MSTTNKKQIQKLKKQYKREQKAYDLRLKRLSTKQDKLQKQIDVIEKLYSKLYFEKSKAYYKIEKQIQELCNHSEYPVRKSENLRDDASFKYRLYCSNCDSSLNSLEFKRDMGYE